MIYKTFLPVLLFLFNSYYSQTPSLSRYEKCWVVWHPLAALKVKKISQKCNPIYNNLAANKTPDQYQSGGKMDAFRHMFFMAAYAQKIKARKLRKLGEKHEKGNYRQFTLTQYEEGETPDSLGSVMDLRNNEAGFILGKLHKTTTLSQLAELVMDEIKKGNGWMMRRNDAGKYMDCDGKVIDLKKYKGKWVVPKCLVKTNEE